MLAGATARADLALLTALRLPGAAGTADVPDWLVTAARRVTFLGQASTRAVLAAAAALLLLARTPRREALVLAAAWGAAQALVDVLKPLAGRPRPPLAFHLVAVHQASFPSGHAAGAMLLFPLAGGLLAARGGAVAGIVVALAIGLTRILLGVHWASDVAGGWLLGGAIALLAASVARPAVRNRPPLAKEAGS